MADADAVDRGDYVRLDSHCGELIVDRADCPVWKRSGELTLGQPVSSQKAALEGRHLHGMLVAMTVSGPAWRAALGELPIVRGGRWAVGGSACLALHGLPVDPRDLDLLVDRVAAAELVDGLRGAVVNDQVRWDRGDVRAVRRALAVVHGVEVEILEGVEAVGPAGEVIVATPDLDHVDRIIVSGRRIPVLPLTTMQVLLDATGNRERAAMVAKALGEGRCQAARFDSV